jgi:hypothetical protein
MNISASLEPEVPEPSLAREALDLRGSVARSGAVWLLHWRTTSGLFVVPPVKSAAARSS